MRFRIARILLSILSATLAMSCTTQAGDQSEMDDPEVAKTVHRYTNRLIDEKSPYLLQHAHNPVDWYPWGDEAFEKAARENKPVFLSIGYSTCHWCHVMEEESFENEEVAALLNAYFVAVKVDREERPDIDGYFLTVAQLLNGSGGWPLTAVLTPDGEPFFAATYIPRESIPGRTGMMTLLPAIWDAWQNRKDEVDGSVAKIMEAVESMIAPDLTGQGITEAFHLAAFEHLIADFDTEHGGFGRSPKFPRPHSLVFLLRYWKRTGEDKALAAVEKTLTEMRFGGIYDHLGFGFHRYSTDREWHLPHFEKMLYDQAMISIAYLEAYQSTGSELFRQTAEEIFAYVLRDMISPEGGFYTAEDADSEGEEGLFYLWDIGEIEEILGAGASEVAAAFGIRPEGNYVDEARGTKTALNLLDRTGSEVPEGWDATRKLLLRIRGERIRPLRDDKILTDWNGLMISALAQGGRILDDQDLVEAARGAADFILTNLRRKDGVLLHRYRDGEAAIPGHLDDYAFLVQGLIDLYQATYDLSYLEHASALTEEMLAHFLDTEDGGFYLTAVENDDLPFRQKPSADAAIPSGNSVAFGNLLRLSWLTGRTEFADHGFDAGRGFSRFLERAPEGHTMMLAWHEALLMDPVEVIIVGHRDSSDTQEKLHALARAYLPNMVVIFKPADSGGGQRLAKIARFTSDYSMVNGKATAYVCRGFICNLPTTDTEEMLSQIGP
jgi:uncharacterized protein